MSTEEHGTRRGLLAAVLFAIAIGLFHGASVRPGHTWWGMEDFTAYLIHGRNLFSDRSYADIATVTDPDLPPSLQRKAFPPVFSVVVAAVDRVAGEPEVAHGRDANREPAVVTSAGLPDVFHALPDTVALKRVLAGFFAITLIAVYMAVRRRGNTPVVAATIFFLGTSPYLFAFRELVRSEVVFLMLLFTWFAVVERIARYEGQGTARFGWAVLAGVLLALAYGTRTAALAMVPAVVMHDLDRTRRIRVTTIVMLAVAGAGFLAQRSIMPAVEGGYMAKAANEFGLATIAQNVRQLRWNLQRFFTNGFSDQVALGVTVLTFFLATIGLMVRVRKPTILETFTVCYVAMILLLPTDSAWFRYLIPILPMYMLYTFKGADWIGGRGWTRVALRRRRTALALVAAMVAVTWVGAHSQLSYGPLPDGSAAPATTEVFTWVEENTGVDDVVVFSKSRCMTLATGRPAISYPRIFEYGELSDEEIWRHLEAIDARVLVLKHTPPTPSNIYRMLSHSDQEFLPFVERHAHRLVEVHRNDEFVILSIRPHV